MKHIIYFLLAFILATHVHSQQVMTIAGIKKRPMLDSLVRKQKEEEIKRLNDKLIAIKKVFENITNDISVTNDNLGKATEKDNLNKKLADLKNKLDSLKQLRLKNLDSVNLAILHFKDAELDSLACRLNRTPNFIISGTGGVANVTEAKTLDGNFSVGVKIRLSQYKRIGNKGWIDPLWMYMLFNTKTHRTEDSANLAKTILFPEISKRDFVLGFEWHFHHDTTGISIVPTAELSLNRYKTTYADSTSKSIDNNLKEYRTESGLIGIKFSKLGTFTIGTQTLTAGCQLFPYYSVVNIQTKYQPAYLTGMRSSSTSETPITLHSLGLQAILQTSDFMIYCNMKYVLNPHDTHRVSDMRGFVYSVGTIVNVDIFKLRIL
jgi:hypothetical protein